MENLITFSEETFPDIETEIRKDFDETHDIKATLKAFCRHHSDYDEMDNWKDGILLHTLNKRRYLLIDVRDNNLTGIRVKMTGSNLDIKLLSDFQFDMEDRLVGAIAFDDDTPLKKKLARIFFLPALLGIVAYGIGLCLYFSYCFWGGFSWYSVLLPLLISVPIGALFVWMMLDLGERIFSFFTAFQLAIYGVSATALRYLLLANFETDASFLTATALLLAIPGHILMEVLLGAMLGGLIDIIMSSGHIKDLIIVDDFDDTSDAEPIRVAKMNFRKICFMIKHETIA